MQKGFPGLLSEYFVQGIWYPFNNKLSRYLNSNMGALYPYSDEMTHKFLRIQCHEGGEVIKMGELNVDIRPDNPWNECNCLMVTSEPMVMVIPNVPMKTVSDADIGAGVAYKVKKTDHPNGLIVVRSDHAPAENMATLPVIFTERTEIDLPLTGWPRGGGVIFL